MRSSTNITNYRQIPEKNYWKKRNKLNFNKLPYQQVSVEEKIQKLNPRGYEENGYHQVNQIKELK